MSFGLMSETTSVNNNPSIWEPGAPDIKQNDSELSKLWFDKAPGGRVNQTAPEKPVSFTRPPPNPPSMNLSSPSRLHYPPPLPQQQSQQQQQQPQQQQAPFVVQKQQFRFPNTVIPTGYGQTLPPAQTSIPNTLIIAKGPTMNVRPMMQPPGPYISTPTTQAFVRSYQMSPVQATGQAPPQQPQQQQQQRRSRTQHQTNLHYALSDCQEQFNDLKSELKLRKRCERDNLKTEELCTQFETVVLPALMVQLEKCSSEKHWVHIEEHARQIIERCKDARSNEKRLTASFGNRSNTLEAATQQVTDSLVKLTQCLRVCRTLLWASQVPLPRYPPRLADNNNATG